MVDEGKLKRVYCDEIGCGVHFETNDDEQDAISKENIDCYGGKVYNTINEEYIHYSIDLREPFIKILQRWI